MLNLILSIVATLTALKPSQLAQAEVWPFGSSIDFGISVEQFKTSTNVKYKETFFSCDGTWIYTTEIEPVTNETVDVLYKFYTGTPFKNNGKIVSGLFSIEVFYRDLDMTSDDGIVQEYVKNFSTLFNIKYKTKNGQVVYTNEFNDNLEGYGIYYFDSVWRVINKSGEMVEFNFPTRYRIKEGQVPFIRYRSQYSIQWPECEE